MAVLGQLARRGDRALGERSRCRLDQSPIDHGTCYRGLTRCARVGDKVLDASAAPPPDPAIERLADARGQTQTSTPPLSSTHDSPAGSWRSGGSPCKVEDGVDVYLAVKLKVLGPRRGQPQRLPPEDVEVGVDVYLAVKLKVLGPRRGQPQRLPEVISYLARPCRARRSSTDSRARPRESISARSGSRRRAPSWAGSDDRAAPCPLHAGCVRPSCGCTDSSRSRCWSTRSCRPASAAQRGRTSAR